MDTNDKPKRNEGEAPAPLPSVQVNVTQQAAPPQLMVLRDTKEGPGCLVQFLWFLVLGGVLSQAAILVGYLLTITVLLMPAGIWLLNKVPYLATLQSPPQELTVTQDGSVISVTRSSRQQRHWLSRLLYFLVIGFWFGFVVIELAWLLTATVLLSPLGLRLFAWSPTAISLRR